MTDHPAPNNVLRTLAMAALLAAVVPAYGFNHVIEQDAHGLGMGGAVAAISGGPHAVHWNPAGIARATVPMGLLGGALKPAPDTDGFNTVLLYPTRTQTVFGLSQFSDLLDGSLASTTYLASAGMPLSSARDVLFGVNLKYLSLTRDQGVTRQKGRGLGFDLGLSYDLHLPRGGNVLSFALVAKDVNTQVRFGSAPEEPVTRTFVTGIAFQETRTRLELDYEIVDRTLSTSALHNRLKVGVERFFMVRNFSVRAGYDDLLEGGGHFSAGAGYHPAGPFEVDYAVQLSETDNKLSHILSAVFRLDKWIRPGEVPVGRAPEIDLETGRAEEEAAAPLPGRPVSGIPLKKRTLTLSPAAFSPNHDGKNDAVTVIMPAIRGGDIARWELAFQSSRGQVERRMSGTGSPPPILVWDGVNEAGKVCADGAYRALLRTFDEGNNLLSDDFQPLTIATGKVVFGIRSSASHFSPLRGARKVAFTVLSENLIDVGTWEFEVSESGTGRVVYATRGRGRLPKRLEWDGKNAAGRTAPDGSYLCMLVAEDRAGNRLQGDAQRVTVDTLPPELRVKVPAASVDFAKTPRQAIGLDAADRSGLSEWRLALQDDEKKEVRVFEGRGNPPGEVQWDGTDANGSRLAPGSFVSARLTGVDAAGNLGTSDETGVQLAVAPPADKTQLTLNLVTILFAPDAWELADASKRELDQAAGSIKPYLAKSQVFIRGFTGTAERGDALVLSRKRAVAVRAYLAQVLGVPEGRLFALGMGNAEPPTGATMATEDKRRSVVVTLYAQP